MRTPWRLLCESLRRLDGTTLPPREWLRSGWPRVFAVPMLACLPLAISGAVRSAFQVGLPAALAVAAAISALCLVPLAPALAARRRDRGMLAVTLVAAMPIAVLYTRAFGGLLNFQGVDAGFHLAVQKLFVEKLPQIYSSCNAFHAVTWWLQRLGLNAYHSYSIAFYLVVVTVAVVPCLIAVAGFERHGEDRTAVLVGSAACVAGSFALQWMVVLPVEHLNQADGFYTQVFGALPLFAFWWIDAMVRQPTLRVAALLVAVGVTRYVYALNLADLSFALAAILGIEAWSAWRARRSADARPPAWRPWLLVAGAAPLVILGLVILERMRVVLPYYGYFHPYELPLAMMSGRIMLAALLLALALDPLLTARSGLARGLRFPIVFGVFSLCVTSWIDSLHLKYTYYLHKHPQSAGLLLAGGAVVALSAAAGGAAAARRRLALRAHHLTSIAILLGLISLSIWSWRRAYERFQPTFVTRAYKAAPYSQLRPLVDFDALHRIEETLKKGNKTFGGYLTVYRPMFNFMNAMLGLTTDPPDNLYHYGPILNNKPGHCVFWDDPANEYYTRIRDHMPFTFPLFAIRDGIHAGNPDRVCEKYTPRWDDKRTNTLCHKCW